MVALKRERLIKIMISIATENMVKSGDMISQG